LAGVESGFACFCGESPPDPDASLRVSSAHCHHLCFGSAAQMCGGDGHIGIYQTWVGACGGSLSGPSGVIYSPGYPGNGDDDDVATATGDHGNGADCTWSIDAVWTGRETSSSSGTTSWGEEVEVEEGEEVEEVEGG
ncbi:unnamed protein product, partial [Lampetra fluviatilis]